MKKMQQKRRGFAMIMAIFFMIMIATLLSYMLTASSETAERTTTVYVNEQAQLLAKSAVEYALLRVSGYNRDGNGDGVEDRCLQNLAFTYPDNTNPILDITVNINYHGLNIAGCTGNGTVSVLATAESVGTMLIDVYVENNAGLGLSEPVRYHRRTLQKL